MCFPTEALLFLKLMTDIRCLLIIKELSLIEVAYSHRLAVNSDSSFLPPMSSEGFK